MSNLENKDGILQFMHILEKLKTTKRAGWVREKAREPESIADHMYRMAILAMLSQDDPDLDVPKCVMLAIVHDLAEAEVGDITPLDGIPREEKHRREEQAMKRFTNELLPAGSVAGKRIWDLWLEYEQGKTREAKFVKDLDRYELALQGVEYEKSGYSVQVSFGISSTGTRDKLTKLQPFFDDTVPRIAHPEVKTWANKLYATFFHDHHHAHIV
ncbi:HD domain-containing protein [Melampsora americana]|nr:HD domain-containing protein [Melampsora americana]